MLRCSLVFGVALAIVVPTALAEEPTPIKLTLTPAKPPTPALRYQRLPDARLNISDDAASIYWHVGELLNRERFGLQKTDVIMDWTALPVDRLPKEAVRKELAEFDDVFELLDRAACCDRCNWSTLERMREKGGTEVPDGQPVRKSEMLLNLRARLEMAEGHFDQALVTLRNGFAMARHTANPDSFLLVLVGCSIASLMEDRLDQFIARPGSPNLYYALTDLPTPLLDLRKPLQAERLNI